MARTTRTRKAPPAATPPARLVVEAVTHHAGMRRGERAVVDAGDPSTARRVRRGYLRVVGADTTPAPALALVRKAVTGVVPRDQDGPDDDHDRPGGGDPRGR